MSLLPLLADVSMGGISLVQLAITVVILAGVTGIVFVVVRNSGIAIPLWVYHILGILLLCFVAVIAIKVLAGL